MKNPSQDHENASKQAFCTELFFVKLNESLPKLLPHTPRLFLSRLTPLNTVMHMLIHFTGDRGLRATLAVSWIFWEPRDQEVRKEIYPHSSKSAYSWIKGIFLLKFYDVSFNYIRYFACLNKLKRYMKWKALVFWGIYFLNVTHYYVFNYFANTAVPVRQELFSLGVIYFLLYGLSPQDLASASDERCQNVDSKGSKVIIAVSISTQKYYVRTDINTHEKQTPGRDAWRDSPPPLSCSGT